jgi:hypothetical protein
MNEQFGLLKLIVGMGKSLIDNLFAKKLTKEDVEAIIAKHHINQTVIKEKIFVVINENQELMYNERGELYIKNSGLDKMKFQQDFLQLLLQKVQTEEEEVIWTDAEVESDNNIKALNPPLDKDLMMIEEIKQKHKKLYGKQ